MLRSIGHILEKRESKNDPKIKIANQEWWKKVNEEKEENSIFFEFIKVERDETIKEYFLMYADEGVILTHENGDEEEASASEYMPMALGKFAGDDCRYLLREAYLWWHEQVDWIEKRALEI